MWKLMKANFRNNYIGAVIFFGIFFIGALINSVLGNWEIQLASLMLALVWLVGVIVGPAEIKTKKIRFMAMLPVSARALAIHQIAMFIIGWLGMIFMLFLSTIISRRGHIGPDYVYWLLTKTGSMFLLIGSSIIPLDLYFCVKDRKWGRPLMKWVLGPLFPAFTLTAGMALYIFTIAGPARFSSPIMIGSSELLLTFPGAFGLFLFGCATMILTVFVYERRKSYADQSTWPQY